MHTDTGIANEKKRKAEEITANIPSVASFFAANKATTKKGKKVRLTAIEEDETLVGIIVEGAFSAKDHLNGQLESYDVLNKLTGQTFTRLPITGRLVHGQHVREVLAPTVFSAEEDANYMLSKMTSKLGSGQVLFFTGQRLENSLELRSSVFDELIRFFSAARAPPEDSFNAYFGNPNFEELHKHWSSWAPYTIEHAVHKISDRTMMAVFLQLAPLALSK